MSTVAAGIAALFSSGGKFAHLAKKGAELVRAAESNPAALARFEETIAEAGREMLKDSYAAVRALAALALDRDPSDPEVDAVFAEVAEHPNAPFRFHRLFGEGRKSSSQRRRRFLASILFGLPFSNLPDDERDRVDMVVERLMPEDVLLLVDLSDRNRTAPPGDPTKAPPVFVGTQLSALINGVDVRIATTADFHYASQHGPGFDDRVFVEKEFFADQLSFGTLVSLGCIDVGQSSATTHGPWQVHRLMITQLGRLVVQAIEAVRPGFAAASE